MRHKSMVWAKIPRAGLGNKLLVLASAMVFAKLNGLKLTTTNLVSFHIGPMLRREKSLRYYKGYFKQDSFWQRFKIWFKARNLKKIYDHKVEFISDLPEQTIYIFQHYKFWMHFFDQIRDYRHWVKPFFFEKLIRPSIIEQLNALESPVIAVHIRLGDFKKLEENDNFKALDAWCIRTPINYFVEAIQKIRINSERKLKVMVFTDGKAEEIEPVLNLPDTFLAEDHLDLIDLLLMSRSKVILPSPSSTFSLLAAYLSEAIILHHPDFYMRPIRPESVNQKFYEGPIQLDQAFSPELIDQLKKI